MHNNSLINLLKNFTQKEINDFKEFLISPYFNKKNSVIKLYEIIQKYYPDFISISISKKNIYRELFPGKEYNDSNFRVLVHNLNELAKKFIAYKTFEDNKIEFDFNQFTGLMNKQQFSHLEKLINRLLSNLENEDLISDVYNYSRFRIERVKIYYLSVSHKGVFEKFLDRADFEKVFFYLSSFYYINSMRLYINVLNIQIIYKKEFNNDNFEKMISLIDKNIFNINPVIEIYYCIIKLFDKDNEENYYFRIKEILNKISNSLHSDDLDEIYINLTNYCNRKIATGSKIFENEKFELYKSEIELKLYLVKGYMSPVYYKNLVILALNLKEFIWIKEFMFNYKNELPADSGENVFMYCMALYEFDMKEFESSLEFLSKIKYDELYLKFDSKILQLMIYYEMNSVVPLISSLEAFRQFLSNNKLLPPNKKEAYKNFYKYFIKIVNHNINKDKYELEHLKTFLSGNVTVFKKYWLIEKINKLLSG